MFRILLACLLLAPLALPQEPPFTVSGAVGAPYFKTDDGRVYDPTNPTTWGLPYAPALRTGWPCVPWPIYPPPFPVPLPWWGP